MKHILHTYLHFNDDYNKPIREQKEKLKNILKNSINCYNSFGPF